MNWGAHSAAGAVFRAFAENVGGAGAGGDSASCVRAPTPDARAHPATREGACAPPTLWVAFHSTTTTRLPSTSSFGVMPRPGLVLAAMRPFTRCGAPSAMLTGP